MQRWLRPGSVAAQVTLVVLGILVLMGGLNWSLAGYALRRILLQDANDDCLQLARAVAVALAARSGEASVPPSPVRLGQFARCRLAVVDAAGRLLAFSQDWPAAGEAGEGGAAAGDPRVAGAATATAGSEPRPVAGTDLYVLTGVDEAEVRRFLRDFNRRTLAVSAASLALALVASWLLARRILQPVRDLVRGLRSVARGEFDLELPARGGEEWRHLIGTFNRMVAEVRAYNRDLERRARLDALTGLLNRGSLEEELEWAVRRAGRRGEPVSVLMVDIDQFKAYNDEFGHQAGDEVLRTCAAALKEAVRERDLVGRYGGEELMVILPGADCAEAAAVAERIRASVAGRPWPRRPVTLSVGVACFPRQADRAALLVARADEALYAAKARGRNTVVVWGGPAPDGDGSS